MKSKRGNFGTEDNTQSNKEYLMLVSVLIKSTFNTYYIA